MPTYFVSESRIVLSLSNLQTDTGMIHNYSKQVRNVTLHHLRDGPLGCICFSMKCRLLKLCFLWKTLHQMFTVRGTRHSGLLDFTVSSSQRITMSHITLLVSLVGKPNKKNDVLLWNLCTFISSNFSLAYFSHQTVQQNSEPTDTFWLVKDVLVGVKLKRSWEPSAVCFSPSLPVWFSLWSSQRSSSQRRWSWIGGPLSWRSSTSNFSAGSRRYPKLI